MNNLQCIRILRDFNKWRRGQLKEIPEDNYTVGQAIDYAIEKLKKDHENQLIQNGNVLS